MSIQRYKQIYVDVDSGKWYVSDEPSDSGLRSLRLNMTTPSDSWYIVHHRNTSKLFFQILDSTNTEIIPERVKIIDSNTVQIDFSDPVTGILNLTFTMDEFYNI